MTFKDQLQNIISEIIKATYESGSNDQKRIEKIKEILNKLNEVK